MTESAALPPAPTQVRLNVLSAVRIPEDTEPDDALLPLQAPLAEQLFELLADQLSVVELPLSTIAVVALKFTEGTGADWLTVITTV